MPISRAKYGALCIYPSGGGLAVFVLICNKLSSLPYTIAFVSSILFPLLSVTASALTDSLLYSFGPDLLTYYLFVFAWSDRIIKFTDLTNINLTNTPIYGTVNCLFFDSYDYLWVGTFEGIIRIKITNQDIRSIKQEDVGIPLSTRDNIFL
jgi:hypothetical protein